MRPAFLWRPSKAHLARCGALALSALLALMPPWIAAGPLLPTPLSVNLNSEAYNQVVTGDGARSFLINGRFHKTNIDIYFNQTIENGPTLNSQLSLQGSDDPLVMGRGGRYKALGGFISLGVPQQYRLEAGYIIPKATRATLTSTVLGLGGYYQINADGSVTRLSLTGGQIQPGVDGTSSREGSWEGL